VAPDLVHINLNAAAAGDLADGFRDPAAESGVGRRKRRPFHPDAGDPAGYSNPGIGYPVP
jgi:hypothetical protein